MIKVQVMRFRVSNAASSPLEEDYNTTWYKAREKELVSETRIQNAVNKFIQDKEVIDIKVNTININYHNNARGNTVDLIYTIMYKD